MLVNGSGFMVNGLDYLPNVLKKEGETWNELLYRLSQLFSLHGQNRGPGGRFDKERIGCLQDLSVCSGPFIFRVGDSTLRIP